MPRRYSTAVEGDTMGSAMSPDTLAKKTERSHEENQERAYIAASRRQDRSIEARMQSAHMASEIHKKRTGKSFRITEDIVRREEMYEEEDDELSRSFRRLSSKMQTDSPEFNARIEAWMNNRLAMSKHVQGTNTEWNDNHINRLFAQSFPHAGQQAKDISRHMSIPGIDASQQLPISPPNSHPSHSSGSPTNQGQYQHSETGLTPSPHLPSGASISPTDPADTPGCFDRPISPNSMPGQMIPGVAPGMPAQTLPMNHGQPTFTDEIPHEMKQIIDPTMVGAESLDMNNNIYDSNFGSDVIPTTGDFVMTDTVPAISDPVGKTNELDGCGFMPSTGDETYLQTKADEPNWDSFLNDNPWPYEA